MKAHLQRVRAVLALAKAEIARQKAAPRQCIGLYTLVRGGIVLRHKAVIWRLGPPATPETKIPLSPPF